MADDTIDKRKDYFEFKNLVLESARFSGPS
jgi:hypothetical protein